MIGCLQVFPKTQRTVARRLYLHYHSLFVTKPIHI